MTAPPTTDSRGMMWILIAVAVLVPAGLLAMRWTATTAPGGGVEDAGDASLDSPAAAPAAAPGSGAEEEPDAMEEEMDGSGQAIEEALIGAGRCIAALRARQPDWLVHEAALVHHAVRDALAARQIPVNPEPLSVLFDDSGAPRAIADAEPEPEATFLRRLREAGTCRDGELPLEAQAVFLSEPLTGFAAVEQLFDFVVAERAGCGVADWWQEQRARVVSVALEELRADHDELDVLFLYRMAALAAAGRSLDLDPSWVALLLEQQTGEGCWAVPGGARELSYGGASMTIPTAVDQTTGLATFILARVARDRR